MRTTTYQDGATTCQQLEDMRPCVPCVKPEMQPTADCLRKQGMSIDVALDGGREMFTVSSESAMDIALYDGVLSISDNTDVLLFDGVSQVRPALHFSSYFSTSDSVTVPMMMKALSPS